MVLLCSYYIWSTEYLQSLSMQRHYWVCCTYLYSYFGLDLCWVWNPVPEWLVFDDCEKIKVISNRGVRSQCSLLSYRLYSGFMMTCSEVSQSRWSLPSPGCKAAVLLFPHREDRINWVLLHPMTGYSFSPWHRQGKLPPEKSFPSQQYHFTKGWLKSHASLWDDVIRPCESLYGKRDPKFCVSVRLRHLWQVCGDQSCGHRYSLSVLLRE